MSKVLSLTDKQTSWLRDLLENTNPGYEKSVEQVAILNKLEVKGGPVKSEEVNPY